MTLYNEDLRLGTFYSAGAELTGWSRHTRGVTHHSDPANHILSRRDGCIHGQLKALSMSDNRLLSFQLLLICHNTLPVARLHWSLWACHRCWCVVYVDSTADEQMAWTDESTPTVFVAIQ